MENTCHHTAHDFPQFFIAKLLNMFVFAMLLASQFGDIIFNCFVSGSRSEV